MRRIGPRVGAYVLCTRDEQILLTRWNGHGEARWMLPGGGIDHAEDPVDAAVREVAEETGYTVEIDELLGLDTHTRVVKWAEHHSLRIVYAGRITGGVLTHEVGGSSDMAAWFDLADLAEVPRATLVDIALRMAEHRPRTGRIA